MPSQTRSGFKTAEEARVEVRSAVVAASRARMWTCDDGHPHPRPQSFTKRRLVAEVNRRNPGNLWFGSDIACAIFDALDAGELTKDPGDHLRLRAAS